MGAKIPYHYTKFENCPKATFISKYTHMPTSCFFLGALASAIPLGIGVALYNANGHSSSGFLGVVSTILLIIGFIIFFAGGPIVTQLSDCFD